MTIMLAPPGEWTLTEAARLLREPQHRLIYLCEKDVVVPDIGDAQGRGSSRRFSARNLMEFALALKLRDLALPVAVVGAILYTLRSFEKAIRRELPAFGLPNGLRARGAPELRIIVSDGEKLYFSLGSPPGKAKLYGGIDFQRLTSSGRSKPRISERQLIQSQGSSDGLGAPEGSKHARIEVSVTSIAKDLRLED